jgi:hypothetical protein
MARFCGETATPSRVVCTTSWAAEDFGTQQGPTEAATLQQEELVTSDGPSPSGPPPLGHGPLVGGLVLDQVLQAGLRSYGGGTGCDA